MRGVKPSSVLSREMLLDNGSMSSTPSPPSYKRRKQSAQNSPQKKVGLSGKKRGVGRKKGRDLHEQPAFPNGVELTSSNSVKHIKVEDGIEELGEIPFVNPELKARSNAGTLNLKGLAVIKDDVVDEGTTLNPSLVPNELTPSNLVREKKKCGSQKRVSTARDLSDRVCKVARLSGTDSNIRKTPELNNVNVIGQEVGDTNAFKEKKVKQESEVREQEEKFEDNNAKRRRGRPPKKLRDKERSVDSNDGRNKNDCSLDKTDAFEDKTVKQEPEVREQEEKFKDNNAKRRRGGPPKKLREKERSAHSNDGINKNDCSLDKTDAFKDKTVKQEPEVKEQEDKFEDNNAKRRRGRPPKKLCEKERSAHSNDEINKNDCPLDKTDARRKVRDTIRLFHGVLRKLVQATEKEKQGRVDASLQLIATAKILKDNDKYINTKKIMGPVPGVEVGDIFNYRIELGIIGLHRQLQSGIDFITLNGKMIAISIVASGRYDNIMNNSDVLIYSGQGGNIAGGCKQLEDQKLERGNLALKNSINFKNKVRVIRGFKERKQINWRRTTTPTYIYDGLYTVERYWSELGNNGKLSFKFELKRVPHQPELTWKKVKLSKKTRVRKGRYVDDISRGKEKNPICAVNTIDDEKPIPFTYITEVKYPDWCRPIPPKGCDCIDGCLDSKLCACAHKNGEEMPYNHSGALVEEKSLVYECGPSCKCPTTCHNRVSQHGIKLPFEIFKTESRGWGLRCLASIPIGGFVCEYIGELLDDNEADQRIDFDDYLFDIGENHNDSTLRDGLSALIPDMPSRGSDLVDNVGFTLDARLYANVGRFINHSCSPNLLAQNVLYDHDDKRIPHIMFFAAENIPPLQELTYHYNYTIGEVLDSNGNVKEKSCYCGSIECSGRMY